MHVSLLGAVLAASAVVVPVGAVPCTKGKSPSAATTTPSAVASGPQAQAPPPPPAVTVEGPKAPAPDKKVPATSSPRPTCKKKPEGVDVGQKAAAAGPPDGAKSGPPAATPCTKCAANTAAGQPGPDGAKSSAPEQPGPASSPASKPTCSKKPASGTPQVPKPAAETSDPPRPKPDEVKVVSSSADQSAPDNKSRPEAGGDDTETKGVPRPSSPGNAGDNSELKGTPRPTPSHKAGDEAQPKDTTRPGPSTDAGSPRPSPTNTASPPTKAGDGGSSAKPKDPAPSTKGTSGTLGSEIADTPGSVSVTPHQQYSSSVGVLGCMIDTDNVAYWPGKVGCNDICIKLTSDKTGKSRHLLRIDSSGGARDISYQAWKHLTGMSAGGGEPMTWEWADMSACSGLLHKGKMPIAAYNGIGYPNQCMAEAKEQGSSPNWLSQNYELFNYADARCENGPGNACTFDSTTQQVDCGSTNAGSGGKGPGVKDVPYNSL